MSVVQWVLVVWIGLSALAVFVRGAAGSVRRYTMADALTGLVDCGVMIWLVTKI